HAPESFLACRVPTCSAPGRRRLCRHCLWHLPPPPRMSPLSLHDALPISPVHTSLAARASDARDIGVENVEVHEQGRRVDRDILRSEEHTSELQSRVDLVCRLLLEKKQKHKKFEKVARHIARIKMSRYRHT